MNQQKSIYYQTIGDDSPQKLVFLHGILGQGRNWQSIAKKFSKNFQCMIYDQRGHGQSFHPSQGFELSDYAEDLKGILDELNWTDPVCLVGHSMGGRVALQFASLYPELVKRLVIVDIGADSSWETMSDILEMVNFVPAPFADRSEARAFMENEFLKAYPNKMVMEFLYSNLTQRNNQYDWLFSKEAVTQTLQLSRYRDYWALFKNLKMPTLLIRGGRSQHLPKDQFEKILQNNPRIQGAEIPGTGHWVHAEKPRETIQVIEDFLSMDASHKQ